LEGYNNTKDPPLSAPRGAASGGWAAFILPPGASAAAHSGAARATATAAVLQRKLSLRAALLAGQAVVHQVAVVLQHVLQVGVRRQILAKKGKLFFNMILRRSETKITLGKKEGCNNVASLN